MASSFEPSDTITPHQISSDYVSMDTPEPMTPDPSVTASSPDPEDKEDSKRKRKSWGQAIPEYEKILPPGKRAKTDAEKEQRRCERIMRNRRAAATSRDRKKREFEDMEKKVQERDDELAWVRSQAQAQMQRILALAFPDGNIPASLSNIDMSLSRPSDLPLSPEYSPIIEAKQIPDVPKMRQSSPVGSTSHPNKEPSPTLTPALFIKNEDPELDSLYSHGTPQSFEDLPNLSNHNDKLDDLVTSAIANPQPILDTFANIEGSGMTQYPAEVLCVDQQCLPEPSKMASRLNNTKWVNSILVIQLMVANAMSSFSSAKMTWLMSQVLSSLEQIWPQALMSPEVMDMIFPLIHTLIFLPSKATSSRRAFRMAFLRKLLSCSPASARHFDDATSRALRRLSSAEAIQESQRGGITWASLMTIRWVIRHVEMENEIHRKRFHLSPTSSEGGGGIGKRSSGIPAFENASIGSFQISGERTCTPGPHVH